MFSIYAEKNSDIVFSAYVNALHVLPVWCLCTGSAVSSELERSVITVDDSSRSTDDDFDDQPSPTELSDLCKVAL